jgi:5-methylcytosine-specific restriction protein A
MPDAEDFRQALAGFLAAAERDGRTRVEVSAAQLHRALGGYPGANHRIPICCSVMRTSMRAGDSIVISPAAGIGPAFTVRYLLPRANHS